MSRLAVLLALTACSSGTGPRNCHWYYTRYTIEAVLVRPDSLAVGVPIPTDSVRVCLASDPR